MASPHKRKHVIRNHSREQRDEGQQQAHQTLRFNSIQRSNRQNNLLLLVRYRVYDLPRDVFWLVVRKHAFLDEVAKMSAHHG